MKAFVFPGQGAQFTGMGKDLYNNNECAHALMEKANEILGFRITDTMFEGSAEELKQTRITQPAVFLHSVVSALVAAGALSFEDGLRLVFARAQAMQSACEAQPGTMAAILGLPDETVENVCKKVTEETGKAVVAANYNCPGQLVISGNVDAIGEVCAQLKEAGAKRALPLPVGGAFHSPLMQPAKDELQAAIERTQFQTPRCPIYQNVDGKAHTDAEEIKQNLIAQLTASVRWTQEVQNMLEAGADEFIECGPGKALQGMINKIAAGRENIIIRGL